MNHLLSTSFNDRLELSKPLLPCVCPLLSIAPIVIAVAPFHLTPVFIACIICCPNYLFPLSYIAHIIHYLLPLLSVADITH